MAQQERAVRTRQTILDAAAAVFDEKGYDAATIADILERSGATKGGLYFHFASKKSLAEAVLHDHGDDLPTLDPAAPLQSLIDLSHHIGNELPTSPTLRAAVRLATEHSTFRPGGPVFLSWISIVEHYLAQARTCGQVRSGVCLRTAAESLVGAFIGIQTLSQALTGLRDLPARIEALWRSALPQLATPAALPHLRLGHIALDMPRGLPTPVPAR